MIAIQVKSGEKYRRGEDYVIPCNANDLAVWRGSLVPIVDVVDLPCPEPDDKP